jgi:hypothetical protein
LVRRSGERVHISNEFGDVRVDYEDGSKGGRVLTKQTKDAHLVMGYDVGLNETTAKSGTPARPLQAHHQG